MKPQVSRGRRIRNAIATTLALALVLGLNLSVGASYAMGKLEDYRHSRPDYVASHGRWQTVVLPDEHRVRAVHAALLRTGEVLLIAGSGNSQAAFDEKTFRTVLWNPATGTSEDVPTPEDLFCGGHAFLPNGDLLVAGGTAKYQVLAEDVEKAAGALWLKNETGQPQEVRKGDVFVRQSTGDTYTSTEDVTVPAARFVPGVGREAGQANVWVESDRKGARYAMGAKAERFDLTRLAGPDRKNLYAWSNQVTMNKQDYRGLKASYVFSVAERRYVKTESLNVARWYPTLISLNGGNVLAVSGLDEHGALGEGHNEVFDLASRTWKYDGSLDRFFPTYPALFRLADGRLFYSGSNTGYGSDKKGRQPGIWDVTTNTWQDVPGLREPTFNETSTSFLLAPAQSQRVGIVGGGGVGESDDSTGRLDVVDLDATPRPSYHAAADYPSGARYLSTVTLPDDHTLITGGSREYRGRSLSDLHLARLFDPTSNTLTEAAPNRVGRNYHSTAVLLPDGRVMTMGSDPLFSDARNQGHGTFETRLEIYSPPYLFTGTQRPTVTAAPEVVGRGTTFNVGVQLDGGRTLTKLRLIRPSAVTHLTDTEQRSVALEFKAGPTGAYRATLDPREGITPSGWYMLFAVDDRGVPSVARWVEVR